MEDFKLVIEIYYKLDGELDSYWQIFVAVYTAIIGWLVIKKDKFDNYRKVVCTVAYGVFVVLIFFAINDDFKFFLL